MLRSFRPFKEMDLRSTIRKLFLALRPAILGLLIFQRLQVHLALILISTRDTIRPTPSALESSVARRLVVAMKSWLELLDKE